MSSRTADPMVGRTVGHFEIVSRLGGGGMGVVYRAIDHKLGRTVAVKFLPSQWSHDETAKQRFIREAQAASATHHPNICTIHDVETADDGQLFIVMAYYEGPTLKQRLEGGPLPIEEALDIATQLADGLAKAHAQGVLHRDIKPGNLILTEDGVRIVDFGLATFADAVQLTAAGSTLGTAAYMSPEQSRGEEADPRTDVWAAGVVLYEMLSGHVPFRGTHAEAIAYAIRHDAPPPLRAERPEIPEEVEQLVFRALHKDPAIRFQSGRELARALRQVRGFTVPQDLRTQVVMTGATEAPATAAGKWLVPLAIVVVLLGATLTWLLLPVERVRVAVLPMVNETGFPQLDGYGFALAEELSASLRESRFVNVVGQDRIREIVRGFRRAGQEGTDVEVVRAVSRFSGAAVLAAPRVIDTGDALRLQIDLVDPQTSTTRATLAAAVPTTSLLEDATYELTAGVASVADRHFAETAGRRVALGDRLRVHVFGARAVHPRFKALTAARAFERGLEAYEQLEYDRALEAFTEASKIDTASPLPWAWRSRALLLMRRDAEAADAARQARDAIPSSALSTVDQRLVEAMVAEGVGDDTTANRYRALVEEDGSIPSFHMELGGLLERQGDYANAIVAYRRAIESAPPDIVLPRADLELCRLYAPTRENDRVRAREHADRALDAYRALRSPDGSPYVLEAQVSMCRVDLLVGGSDADRRQAPREADDALAILVGPETRYQRARALYYRALAASTSQERRAYNEDALTLTQATSNAALEPLVRMNLGAALVPLGRRREAIEHYEASSAQFQALGDEQRAANALASLAGILVEFGDAELAQRFADNAIRVAERRSDSRSLVFPLQVKAAYLRNAGRHHEALQLLNRAITIAQEQKFASGLPSLVEDRARSMIDLGQYTAARGFVTEIMSALNPRQHAQTEIRLAQIDTRLGDFAAARMRLQSASKTFGPDDANGQILLRTAYGELEYEVGRPRDAATHFRAAADLWGDDLPHSRAVEAVAYTGLLDALDGKTARGVQTIEKSLKQATLNGRLSVMTRCRLFLARIALRQRRADEALEVLKAVPEDDQTRTVGPELRAQVHYWRAQSLMALGNTIEAKQELTRARAVLEPVLAGMSPDDAARYARRPNIGLVLD